MDLIADDVKYASGGAEIDAYFIRPDNGARNPSLILVHEIFGLNDHIRDVARRFANEGYAVIAPDLYSRPGSPSSSGIAKVMKFMFSIPPAKQRDAEFVQQEMAKLPEEERKAVSEVWNWMTNRDYSNNVKDLRSAFGWLSSQDSVDKERIGCLGFCMGGTLTGRLASSGEDLKAAVIFYGENPPATLVKDIKCQVMGLYGGEDHRITDRVPELEEEMAKAGKLFVHHVYPGAHHAFFNDTGRNYDGEAARDAWIRCLGFLSGTLKEPTRQR